MPMVISWNRSTCGATTSTQPIATGRRGWSKARTVRNGSAGEGKRAGAGGRGIGRIGAVGARQGVVAADTMEYKDGKPGGFDPHKRIPDMDADGIDAAFLYASLGLFSGAI